MALVEPFAALSFDPAVTGPLDDLVCPGGGGLAPTEKDALLARSPFNAVRLDDGPDEPGDTLDINRYTRARRQIQQWQRSGALRRDPDPTFYLYEQEHAREGRTVMRMALVALLSLDAPPEIPLGPERRRPDAPRNDRERLLQATHAQIETPLVLVEDPDGDFYDVLDRMQYDADDQRAELRDGAGVLHRFKAVHGPKYAAMLARATEGRRRFSASGQGQLAACRRHRDEAGKSQPDFGPDAPERFALAALVSSRDPGLVLAPVHRLLRVAMDSSALKQRIGTAFTLAPGRTGELPAPGQLLLLVSGEALRLTPHGAPAAFEPIVAHDLAIREALGIPETDLSIRVSFADRMVDVEAHLRASAISGGCQAALLLPPPTLPAVLAAAAAGPLPCGPVALPPGLLAGFVIRKIEGL